MWDKYKNIFERASADVFYQFFAAETTFELGKNPRIDKSNH